MYEILAEVEVKSGDFIAIGMIKTPGRSRAEEIKTYLGHTNRENGVGMTNSA